MNTNSGLHPQLPHLEAPDAPDLNDRDLQVPNRSPSSVVGFDPEPNRPSNLSPLEIKDCHEGDKRFIKVSPTMRFIRDNQVRSKSPTDIGRSPNHILRKRYQQNFSDESARAVMGYANS